MTQCCPAHFSASALYRPPRDTRSNYFVNKIFVISRLITKFTKILCHENLELYGIYNSYIPPWGVVGPGDEATPQGSRFTHWAYTRLSVANVYVIKACYGRTHHTSTVDVS